MKMGNIRYTKELLVPIVSESVSVAQVLRKLGLNITGGSYSHIKSVIQRYEIDMSHFTGQSHNKGKKYGRKYNISKYLVLSDKTKVGRPSSDRLKKMLIKEGIKEEKCEDCEATMWMGRKIPLDLHHINENGWDNRLENLKVLCPNCHALYR